MSDHAEILSAQKEYFLSGETKPLKFRLEQLERLKEMLKKEEKEIIDAVYKDFSKPAFETFGTEIGLVISEINFVVKNLDKWTRPTRVPTTLVNFPSRNYLLKEPYGSVLIISPWNYPVLLCLLPLVGAIAAGNTAVLKPSELTPHTSGVLEKLISRYFDPRLIKVINGDAEISASLVEMNFDYIFFTGSTRVGKLIMQSAAKRLIPVTLELGGKSPCVVDETADLEISAKRIAWGKFVNAGQTCVAPDYLLVKEEIKEEFTELLREAILSLYGEHPFDNDDYAHVINNEHFDRLSSFLDEGTIVIGGERDPETCYFSPTLMTDITWEHKIMKEEVFGPVLPVLSYSTLQDANAQIHNAPRPLALYLFTTNDKTERYFLENVSFGGGAINDTIAQLANHHLSFGGVGSSGFGSYHGKASFDSFSHQKSIMKKNFMLDIPLRYAPYDGKIKWLKTIFR